jgi:hypothetical protein
LFNELGLLDSVPLAQRISSKKAKQLRLQRCNRPIKYDNKVDFWTNEEDRPDGLGVYSKDANFPPRPPSPAEEPSPIALEVARRFGHLPIAQQVNGIVQLERKKQARARHTGWNPSDGTPVNHRFPLRPAPLAARPGPTPAPLLPKPSVPLVDQLGPPINNSVQICVVKPVGDFKHKTLDDCNKILLKRVHATICRINAVFEQYNAVCALPPDVYKRLHNLGNQLDGVSALSFQLARGPIALYKTVHHGLSVIGQVSFKDLKKEFPCICRSLADISEFGYFDHVLEVVNNPKTFA